MRPLVGALIGSLLAPVSTSWGQPREPGSPGEKLVGTWRLVLFEDVENGRKITRAWS